MQYHIIKFSLEKYPLICRWEMKYVTKLDSKVAYRQYDLCCKGTIDRDTPTH